MFLALRDLRFARGRFALMGAVIALISLLVVMLSGLASGLGAQSISALDALPTKSLVFARPADGQSLSFAISRLDGRQVTTWQERGATPLGVAPARLSVQGREVAITAFGVDPGSSLAPTRLTADTVVVSDQLAAEQHLSVGDVVTMGGRQVRVTATRGDAAFNHTPVVWIALNAWRHLDAAAGAGATVMALSSDAGATSAVAATAASTGTTVVSRSDARAAVGSYTAENGSLTLMRLLLLAVSALVVGAFFTVWTIQRSPDLAVLKAIGASTWYLLRDALAQSLTVLAIGGAAGTAVAAALGAFAAQVVPFVVSPRTTLVPLAGLLVVGMVGAAAAVRRISSVDPLTALGAAR